MSQACAIRPWNVQRYLDHEFSAVAVERGKECFKDEKVEGLRVARTSVFAFVNSGNGEEEYTVTIEHNAKTDGVITDCTCPTGYSCEHAAATLMAYAEMARTSGSVDDTSLAALKRQIEEWTSDVQYSVAAAISASRSATEERPKNDHSELACKKVDAGAIAYVLSEGWSQKNGRTPLWGLVERSHTHSKKRGTFTKPRPQPGLSDWEKVQGLAQFGADETDLEVAVHVAGEFDEEHYDFRILTLDGSSALFELLLKSGRLFVTDHHQTGPLTRGRILPGELAWEPETDELLPTLRVGGEKLPVIPIEPLHYIDMNKMQCGPIELNCPAPVALTFLRSPPTTEVTHPLVRGALLKAAEKYDIPLPPSNGEPDLIAIEPKPILKLRYQKPPDSEPEMGLKLYADLSFLYDDVEVGSDELTMTIRPTKKSVVTHYLRDRAFENEAGAILTKHGFEHTDAPMHRRTVPSWSLPHDEASEIFRNFTFHGIPALRADGWRVEVGEDYPHQSVEPDDWYLDLSGGGMESSWFDLELGVEIDGEQHNLLPFLLKALQERDLDELLADRPGSKIQVELSKGKFVPVPMQRLRTLTDLLVELHRRSALTDDRMRMNQFRLGQIVSLSRQEEDSFSISGNKTLLEWGEKLIDFDGMKDPFIPKSFTGELRSYQRKGLAWLQFLSEYRLSGLLADDMGLGKTLQVLAFIKGEKERGINAGDDTRPTLVVAPTSVVHNWRKEAERFFTDFDVFIHHGESRLKTANAANKHEIIVTSYALLVRDLELFQSIPFHAAVLDEAQAIKNPRTQAHGAVCKLQTRIRLALSGTPVENHLGELWSQFTFLLPGLLDNETDFRRHFRTPIEKRGDSLRMDALRARVRPFVLRRLKSEVEKDLPPKTVILKTVELTGPQRDLYETVRLAMDKRVRALLHEKGLAKSSIEILDALLKLRQVCCHPRLLPGDMANGVKTSAKIDDLMEVLEKLQAENRRMLVFSQFTSMLKLVEEELIERDMRYLKLTGATRKRQTLIDEFQEGDVPVFLISLKAGGTGLTLTAADTVIHYDPWWNPAVENQATDRTHRIGQTQPVFVYKMICRDTVEEKIVELQKKKGALASSLLEGKGGLRGFSSEDVHQLFA